METTFLTMVVVLLTLIPVSLWPVLYQLVKQQGRLLPRIDNVEQRLGIADQGVVARGVQLQRESAERQGLKWGRL
jgi:hypothetical protein